ncbi:MAG: hypothetical protein ACR2PQ_02515 [Myxococcota bacterium]
MGSPNVVAYGALLAFVPAAILVMGMTRPAQAAVVLSLAGTLFLPQGTTFDLSGLPSIDKLVLVHFAILLGLVFQHPGQLARLMPRSPVEFLPWLFVLTLIGGGFATALTNQDPTPFAGTLTPYDGISIAIREFLKYAVPFSLGWCLFRTSRDLRTLMIAIVAFGLAYSILTLWEGRMSPQLHRQIYGLHSDAFHRAYRWGGYRPAVFMTNGLAVALQMTAVFAASVAVYRARVRVGRVPLLLAVPYLGAVLVLCKSTAAILYGAGLLPALLLLRARWLSWLAVGLACLVIAYPVARSSGSFPTQLISDLSFDLNEKRGASLQFRFDNEDILLARALERPAFGWGTKDRPALYDPDTGKKLSTVDGYWIVLLGSSGLVGWACVFGLLLVPVFRAASAIPRIRKREDQFLLAGLSLIVATYAVDMLPNGFFSNSVFFLTGCLFGLSGALPNQRSDAAPSAPTKAPRGPIPPAPEPPKPERGRMAGMR